MAEFDFDLFTLGAGSGGVAASRRAGAYGARVAICEEGRVGGTCVLRGCVPKKLLGYAATFAGDFEDAAGFGWSVEATHDWPSLVGAKNRELDRLNRVYMRLLRDADVDLIEGRGKIVDAHTVEVAGRRYTARNILVATGGRPFEPEMHGIEHVITSNEAFDLPRLPRRLAIVGGGYVGVEFASIFQALGSEVTMLVRSDGLLRGFDRDIRAALREEMEKRGITILSETRVHSVECEGEGRQVSIRLAHEELLEADNLLCATGRRPNTAGIGLEGAGVALGEDGSIVVDEWSRTTVPSIYAIGDVTNRTNLTPVAIADGRALAETLFNDNPTRPRHDQIPTAVFSIPPVGTVGLTEEQARQHHGHVDVYRTSFRPMKHTLSGRSERTMMKLLVDRDTDLVLGCHMVGEDAPEIIQGLAIALRAGATKRQFDATLGIHPTAAEEFVTMREPSPEEG